MLASPTELRVTPRARQADTMALRDRRVRRLSWASSVPTDQMTSRLRRTRVLEDESTNFCLLAPSCTVACRDQAILVDWNP